MNAIEKSFLFSACWLAGNNNNNNRASKQNVYWPAGKNISVFIPEV